MATSKKSKFEPNDGLTRCQWVSNGNELYYQYHDNEWGVPVHDDRIHFEFLILEGVQAGLSWATVLNKRENYRAAMDGFDPEKIARYSDKKIEALMSNSGLVRNRLKIEASVINARCFLDIQQAFGSFDAFVWDFVDGEPIQGKPNPPVSSPESERLSRALKQHGFKFVGPTIIYAHMQAVGMINDHDPDCYRREEVAKLAKTHNK